jgi:hypothetical protein
MSIYPPLPFLGFLTLPASIREMHERALPVAPSGQVE